VNESEALRATGGDPDAETFQAVIEVGRGSVVGYGEPLNRKVRQTHFLARYWLTQRARMGGFQCTSMFTVSRLRYCNSLSF
jgi:hypothetical protein